MNAVVYFETLRRHVTSGGYIAYLALLAIIALGASAFDRPGAMWPTLISGLAIITGAGVIGPEFSSGTLQLVLVKPVNRAIYLLSRVAGVVSVVWIAAFVATAIELLSRLVWRNGNMFASTIGITLLNAMTDAILTVSLLALLGSLTRAYFNVAIYVATMISFSVGGGILGIARMSQNVVGEFLKKFPQVQRGVDVLDKNLFPDVLQRFDRDWTLMVLANAAIALVLACFAFRRREVPYGAD